MTFRRRMANISCLIFLLLLLAASSEGSNTTEAIDLQLPRFLEETFPYLTSDATNLFPPPPKLTSSQTTASTEGSFVTPHPDAEDVTAVPEDFTFEELFQDFGDIVKEDVWDGKDDVDIEGAESREASIYRIAKEQRQEYEEYDYETGFEVDVAEPRSSSYGAPKETYGAPQETYGAPQETYGSPHEEPYGSYDSGHKVN